MAAENLAPKENHTKKRMHFRNDDLSDGILIAQTVNGYAIEPDANLRGADLKGATLSNADLSRANLTPVPT